MPRALSFLVLFHFPASKTLQFGKYRFLQKMKYLIKAKNFLYFSVFKDKNTADNLEETLVDKARQEAQVREVVGSNPIMNAIFDRTFIWSKASINICGRL